MQSKQDGQKERWRDIKGYEGLYQISDMGRVKSLRRERRCGHPGSRPQILRERILKPWISRKGYPYAALCKGAVGKSWRIPRLVAHAYIANPHNKPEVNHKDGVKGNNTVGNLEWVTTKENNHHCNTMLHREYNRGSKRPDAKITESDVPVIRARLKQGDLGRHIARDYKVSPSHISLIKHGKTWKHVPAD